MVIWLLHQQCRKRTVCIAIPPTQNATKVSIDAAEQTKFEDLHKSITACDDILTSVEANLASFRDDLANVSADIESLQDRSTALNKRLENRRKIEKALAPMVDDLSLSPEIITKVAAGAIDESWIKVLADLDRKATAFKKKAAESAPSKAASDLEPLLEKLMQKAIERIRDFIVTQIKALRSPNINAQVIQQQKFIKFKELFHFLHRHHSVLADEIAQAYLNTMRWYYQSQFTRYDRSLAKMKLHILDKTDTIGYEETSRMGGVLSVTRTAGSQHDAFNLGRRMEILKASQMPALSSHLAEEDKVARFLESPFRNLNLALIDNATAEYTFMATYFAPSLSFAKINQNFNFVFDPSFAIGQELSKTLVTDSYDAIGVLLCIRLNQQQAFELQRRKVPTVDGYINVTNMLLWPRFQVIMDKHSESVKQLSAAVPAKPSKSDVTKLSAAPHMVTQRFGQLLQAFLALSEDAGDDEPVVASLFRLRTEVEGFLTKIGNSYGTDRRKSSRFMYNNYSLIHTIIGDATGKLAEDQQEHFEELKRAYQEDD